MHRYKLQSTLFWILLILLFLLALGLTAYRIDEPLWESYGHHPYHMGEYPRNALNYLRYGYLRTRFGMVENLGDNTDQPLTYRVDHQPMLPLLISVAYALFGVHFWSARLFPVLMCLGTSLATMLLAVRMTDNRWLGLLAFVFSAFSPMFLFDGRIPMPKNGVVFFGMLMVLCYWQWFTTGKRKWLYGLFGTAWLAVNTNWQAYFTIAALALHYLWFHRQNTSTKLRHVLLTGVGSVLVLASYFLWTSWLTGGSSIRTQLDVLLFRTGSRLNDDWVFTSLELWRTHFQSAGEWLTTPVSLLGIVWFVLVIRDVLARRVSAASGLLLCLFALGGLYNRVFSNTVMIHDFERWYHFVPLFAVAAAWVLHRTTPGRVARGILVLIVLAIFADEALNNYMYRQQQSGVGQAVAYFVGDRLHRQVSPTGRYLTTTVIHPRITTTVADRPFDVVKSLDQFREKFTPGGPYEAMLVANSPEIEPELRTYLLERYPRVDLFGYSLFELTKAGSNVLVENPTISHPLHVNFNDKVEYLGYDLEETVYRNDQDIPWWQWYLVRHADLLPQYRTTFRVVNYWRKLSDDAADYHLITQFDALVGSSYRLESTYPGLDSLYPTSMWPVGQIVREEFEVAVPHEAPSLRYAMWVGVQDGQQFLPPIGNALSVDETGRVSVGAVDIRPRVAPPSLPALPRPQYPTLLSDGRLSLLGYDANASVDGITITTYWQKLAEFPADYHLGLRLENLFNRVDCPLDNTPPRLWQVGGSYQGRCSFTALLARGVYTLSLVARLPSNALTVDNNEVVVPLAHLEHCRGTDDFILLQLGQPDGAPDTELERVVPSKPWQVMYQLARPEDVEVVIGWTGRSQYDQTRLRVSAYNDAWKLGKDKYLATLVVPAGRVSVSRIKVPAYLTRVGSNTLRLTIPPKTLIGWKGLAATIIPDLEPVLRDYAPPYAGWIEPDFVQVRLSEPPYRSDGVDMIGKYSPGELLTAHHTLEYNFGECEKPAEARAYEQRIRERITALLEQVDWSAPPPDILAPLAEMADPVLWAEVRERLLRRLPANLDMTLVDDRGSSTVRVLGYALRPPDSAEQGSELRLYFEALGRMERDYTIFLHGAVEDVSLLPPERQQYGFANWDHRPQVPTSRWQPGRIYVDAYRIQTKPGEYRLRFGFWEPRTQARLAVQGSGAQAIDLGWHFLR